MFFTFIIIKNDKNGTKLRINYGIKSLSEVFFLNSH